MSEYSLASSCEQDIENRILSGEFAPGTRLHNGLLAEQYGVTISPIREALSRLTTTGLVRFVDKKGFFVAEINETDFLDILHSFVEIECLALKKAILRGGVDWEALITAYLYRLSKVETGNKVAYLEWSVCNRAFHRALIQGCGLEHLLKCREMIYLKYERYIRLSYLQTDTVDIKVNHEEHRQLAEAVLKGDENKAVALMQSHILSGQKALLENLRKAGLLGTFKFNNSKG